MAGRLLDHLRRNLPLKPQLRKIRSRLRNRRDLDNLERRNTGQGRGFGNSYAERLALETVRPLVSILIPAYNSDKWLAQTLRSAIAQTWDRKEIIVVDDGSRDGTLSVARSFESDIVKVFTQANQGASVQEIMPLQEVAATTSNGWTRMICWTPIKSLVK